MQKGCHKTAILIALILGLCGILFREVFAAPPPEGGRTYEITEPDLLEEIEAKKEVVLQRLREYAERQRQELSELRPSVHLPPADRGYTYEVDLTYELPFDIPKVDKQGRIVGVLYPKGYKFNPLKYLRGKPPVLIVFNAERPEEISCVKRHLRKKYPHHLLIISDGTLSVSEKMGERVYLLNQRIVDRFKLVHTISVVDWDVKKGAAVVQVMDRKGCFKKNKGIINVSNDSETTQSEGAQIGFF